MFDPPSPGKREHDKAKEAENQYFQGVSLRSLFQATRQDLCNDMAAWQYLTKPDACSKCCKEPVYNDGRWECSCRSFRHTVFKDSVFCSGEKDTEDDKVRVRLDVYEAASFVWCFAHEVNPFTTAAITGIALRTVQMWLATFRDMVRVKETAHQDCIQFTSEGCTNGFCHVQGDATRIRKSHAATKTMLYKLRRIVPRWCSSSRALSRRSCDQFHRKPWRWEVTGSQARCRLNVMNSYTTWRSHFVFAVEWFLIFYRCMGLTFRRAVTSKDMHKH